MNFLFCFVLFSSVLGTKTGGSGKVDVCSAFQTLPYQTFFDIVVPFFTIMMVYGSSGCTPTWPTFGIIALLMAFLFHFD